MTVQKEGQIQYLNILRILAIIFVIIVHVINPYITNDYYIGTKAWLLCDILDGFARTGVPLFFMISGFLLFSSEKTLDFLLFYKKRLSKIVLPFLLWDMVYYVYTAILSKSKLDIIAFFKQLLNNGSFYHLWFVYSLLGIYLLLPFLKRITDHCSKRQQIWFLLLIAFTGTIRPFINRVTGLNVYLFAPLVESYIAYFVLGYILGKYELPKKARLIIYLLGIAGFFINVVGNYLLSSHDHIDLLFNSGYDITAFFRASAIFVYFKQRKDFTNKKIIYWVSRLSGIIYTVYLCHALILDILEKNLTLSTPVQYIVANFSITVLVSFTGAILLSKIKYLRKLIL